MSTFKQDCERHPRLFELKPVSDAAIRTWLRDHERGIPDDLFDVWTNYGIGDFYESEELYAPPPLQSFYADIEERTDWYKKEGLQQALIVFGKGFNLYAIDQKSLEYTVLDAEDLSIKSRYRTFQDLYANEIRPAYVDKYKLLI